MALVDEGGVVIARARIDTGATGFSNLLALIGEHGGSIQDTPVALETDKNLLVVALSEAGFTVYPINPRAVARYRERHGQAGGKSDPPGDAAVLAHILRTDQHMHRALPVVSEQGRAVKVLARQHQEAIWALHQAISRLRSALLEFLSTSSASISESEASCRFDRSGGGAHPPGSGLEAHPRTRGGSVEEVRAWQPPPRVGRADPCRPESTGAAATCAR